MIITLLIREKKLGWDSFGGKWPDDYDPIVIKNDDSRLEVFMVGTNKELYHRWQESPGGKWH